MPTKEIFTIKIKGNDYPELLKRIHDPPEILYVRGNAKALNLPALGVVGTRKSSEYGKSAVTQIVSDLAGTGLAIVSGMAHGIDTLAHKTALRIGLYTVAVLGTGIDDQSIYPADNIGLAHRIIESDGAIISEYEPGTHGTQFSFPRRNRIISGLSLGVLVVEADEKSGSLITARCALDQNRDVFAVPGSIFSMTSRGANEIIKKGAKLVTCAEDILEEYPGLKLPTPGVGASLTPGVGRTENEAEEEILKILASAGGPVGADEIIRTAGTDSQKINAQLVIMEINKKVRRVGEKYTT